MSNAKASSGSAHTPRPGGGVAYIPQGAKAEKRFEPGEPLEKCPVEILEQYVERGDVVELARFDEIKAEVEYEVPGLDVAPITEATTLVADHTPQDDDQDAPATIADEPATVEPVTHPTPEGEPAED